MTGRWWWDEPPTDSVRASDLVAFNWGRCEADAPATHEHTIECLWVWHDCAQILGPESVAPGVRFGWRPAGVGLHTLVHRDPLTITASVYWPDCCGLHGFVTNGVWIPA